MTQLIDNLSFPLVTPDRPWPGLAAFDESSAQYFFGRNADGDNLRRLLKRETLTVLFGQSGLGKTSLLQARLFPNCAGKIACRCWYDWFTAKMLRHWPTRSSLLSVHESAEKVDAQSLAMGRRCGSIFMTNGPISGAAGSTC